MKQMLLIHNPRSGRCKGGKMLPQILSIFSEAGYRVTVHTTTGPGDGTEAVKAKAAGMDAVVCCGGDGTFSETVNGLLESGANLPIGYLPAGSTNDFAASLHLPTDLVEAARAIVSGTSQAYDVGKVNGRYFSYVASFGAFTRTSYATSQKLKNKLGFLAYLLGGIQEVFRLRAIPVTAEIDGEIIEGNFLFGAISNSTRMGGIFKLDPKLVDLADGQLELLLVRKFKHPLQLFGCLRAIFKHRYDHKCLVFRRVRSVRFTCPEGTVWTLDGERYDAAPVLQIDAQERAIQLIRKETT